MKASELRIGNIVFSHKDGGLIYIECIPIDIDMYNYGAIKLSEEWFEKFGFNDMGMWKIIKDVEFSKVIGYGLAIKGIDGYNRLNQNSILYVHQLQNLFYALTGNELELKNNPYI